MATIRKQQRRKGTVYVLQVRSFDQGMGKYKFITKTWEPEPNMTECQADRQAEIEAEKFEEETKAINASSKSSIADYNITFKDYSARWLDKVGREYSKSYYHQADMALKHINQVIGRYKLREINPSILQQYFDNLDSRKRIYEYVTIQPNAKEVLKKYGYGIRYIRDTLGYQTTSLIQLYEGKKAGIKWSTEFAKNLKIPFEELFIKHKEEKAYKPETSHKYKKIIRTILSMAKKARLVDDNYASADYIDYPSRKRNSFPAMTDDEIKEFYDCLLKEDDIKIKTSMMLFITTGFRRGEVAGLEWSDVDFDNNRISVNKSVLYTEGFGVYEKDPKTIKSTRTISVPDMLINQLKEYKEWQNKYIETLGDKYNNLNKIFSGDFGGLINPDRLDNWLLRFQGKHGLPHYTLHSLRHTNIALQIATGVPIVTVSKRAGHARTSTTTDIYAYSYNDVANKIEDIFSGKTNIKIGTINEQKENTSFESDVEEFKRIKEEMNKLGFDSLKEYQEYLEFKKMKHMGA